MYPPAASGAATMENSTKLVFATWNRGKVREASEILGPGFTVTTPAQAGLPDDVEESGSTLRANSIIKAEYVAGKLGCDCFADDSGLEVDALGGRPGVHTARYGGEDHNHLANMKRLLSELQGTDARKARFRTVVTLAIGDDREFFEGVLEGRIGLEMKGDGGFGYDPVFIPDEIPDGEGGLRPNLEGLTMAELGEEVKNAISHRGKALRAMAAWLKEQAS